MKPNFAPRLESKTSSFSFIVATALVLACCVFSPCHNTFAVTPPPDGGYPGGNTAEGQNALLSLTSGGYNTAVGYLSLTSNSTGQLNTAVGAGTLLANTAAENTATGAAALLTNSTGYDNTANGAFALAHNTEGNLNTATGVQALLANTTGIWNTATGVNALFTNTEGNYNAAFGVQALYSNTIGVDNTATGTSALFSNTEGSDNTATGSSALQHNTTGTNNTANGYSALSSNIGNNNTAVGWKALTTSTNGAFNTAVGSGALINNTGGGNTAVGALAGGAVTTASGVICIGSQGANVSNSCYIGQIFGATSTAGTAVFINSDGRLGTMTSSRRFKEEIKPMDKASESILALKPVTFRYCKDIDPLGVAQFGLVAEQVQQVNRDLVTRDKAGKPYTVRYEAVNAMLLNEFLKEHRKVEELEKNAVQQQKQIDELTAGLQKVSAQLQVRKSRRQVVLNKQ